jgi:outer membrane immunogenic protein
LLAVVNGAPERLRRPDASGPAVQLGGNMHKLIAGAATAAVLAVSPALAADMRVVPLPGPYVVPPPPSWTGGYVGLNVGYQFGKVDNLPLRPNGVLGGIQGGYNWQTGQFVLGAETDLQLSSADDTFAPYQFSNPWFGTLRARAGWAFSNVLVYATGGLAYGKSRLTFAGLTETYTDVGWTGGGGVEVGLTPHWSAKVEYLYFDLGNQSYVLTGANNGLTSSLLRFGVNYRF